MEASIIKAAYPQVTIKDSGNIVSWSSPQQIVPAAEYAQIAIDHEANIVVVWEEGNLIKGGVLEISNNVFSFKSGPTSISTGGSASSLDFSMNGGKAVAVWLQGDTVQTSTLQTSDTSLTWSVPTTLSQTKTIGSPQVAVDEQGNTLVSWYRSDEKQSSHKFIEVVSQIRNSAWSKVTVLKEGTLSIADTPRIALNGGIGVAVWNNNYIVEGALANIDNESISWNANKTLSDNTGKSYNPQVAVTPSGRVVAIWRFHDDQGNYKIQYRNNDFYNEIWGTPHALSDSDVTAKGFQYVVADAVANTQFKYPDLVYAYWSDMDSQNPIHFSESTSQNMPWSEGKLITFLNVGLELDATFFNETLQVIWWAYLADSGSIQVGYFNEASVPSLAISTVDPLNTNLAQDAGPMIASNNEAGIIVAIWLEQSEQQSPETSKMLIYWGVDDSFQSDFP